MASGEALLSPAVTRRPVAGFTARRLRCTRSPESGQLPHRAGHRPMGCAEVQVLGALDDPGHSHRRGTGRAARGVRQHHRGPDHRSVPGGSERRPPIRSRNQPSAEPRHRAAHRRSTAGQRPGLPRGRPGGCGPPPTPPGLPGPNSHVAPELPQDDGNEQGPVQPAGWPGA